MISDYSSCTIRLTCHGLLPIQEKYQKIIDTHDGGNLEGLRNKKVPRSMKVTVTGHSLGGLAAYLVGNENECYIYNMARYEPMCAIEIRASPPRSLFLT